MTFEEALIKSYGTIYVHQSELCRLLIEVDGGQSCTSDDEYYYFYFAFNNSTGASAILICAEKYGRYEKIPSLFPEDGSTNYRVLISKSAPFQIVHFVGALVYGAEPVAMMGIPVSHVVEYTHMAMGGRRVCSYKKPIDRYSANNIIRLIISRYGEMSYKKIIQLLVNHYGALASSPLELYWLYVRGEHIPCDTLPFSVREIVTESELNIAYEPKVRWTSEYSLFRLVLSYYADTHFHYSAPWLGLQHLDIFIPSIKVGIEYQGKQHYEPVDFFGGEGGFLKQKQLDKSKKLLAEANGIILIEWSYSIPITPINLIMLLSDRGITNFPTPDCSRIPKLDIDECITEITPRIVFEICQYSPSGKYLGKYKSYNEASNATGISDKQILKAANGYAKTAGNFQWRRYPEAENHNDIEAVKAMEQANQHKRIYQVTKDGEVIAEFTSINSAAKETGINRKSIFCVLNGTQKTAGGYMWAYGE